jgi:hypothetical protein
MFAFFNSLVIILASLPVYMKVAQFCLFFLVVCSYLRALIRLCFRVYV